MWKNRRQKPKFLIVTHREIILDDQFYKLQNVHKALLQEVKTEKKSRGFWDSVFKRRKSQRGQKSGCFRPLAFLKFCFIGFIIVILLIYVVIPGLIVIGPFLLIFNFFFKSKNYELILETNSSRDVLLVGRKKSFLKKIVSKINKSINNSRVKSSYTFDLRKDRAIKISDSCSGLLGAGGQSVAYFSAEASHKEKPTLEKRFVNSMRAGGYEVVKVVANHPLVSIPMEIIRGWFEV